FFELFFVTVLARFLKFLENFAVLRVFHHGFALGFNLGLNLVDLFDLIGREVQIFGVIEDEVDFRRATFAPRAFSTWAVLSFFVGLIAGRKAERSRQDFE